MPKIYPPTLYTHFRENRESVIFFRTTKQMQFQCGYAADSTQGVCLHVVPREHDADDVTGALFDFNTKVESLIMS